TGTLHIAKLHRNGELACGAKFVHAGRETREVLAVASGSRCNWLNAFLPAAVQVEAFLRRETQVPLFPDSVAQHAQLFEEFAHQRGFLARDRDVVRRPRVSADFVLSPTRVAAGVLRHFEQDKVVEAALIEPPGGGETRDTTSDDDDRNFDAAFRRSKFCPIPQLVTGAVPIINEAAGNGPICLARDADERRDQELAASTALCVIAGQSCS